MTCLVSSFTDYVNGGELFTHLVQRVRFKEQEVALYSGEIVLALEHLHKVTPLPISYKLSIYSIDGLCFTCLYHFVIAAWDRLSGPETREYSVGFKRSYSSHGLWPQ